MSVYHNIDKDADCPCLGCGATLGVVWADSRTAYPRTGDKDPNAPLPLCPDCRAIHDDYWDEQWENYYASQWV